MTDLIAARSTCWWWSAAAAASATAEGPEWQNRQRLLHNRFKTKHTNIEEVTSPGPEAVAAATVGLNQNVLGGCSRPSARPQCTTPPPPPAALSQPTRGDPSTAAPSYCECACECLCGFSGGSSFGDGPPTTTTRGSKMSGSCASRRNGGIARASDR